MSSDPVPNVALGAKAWFVWGLSVTFVIYYFSFQTGYSISNPKVQADLSLTVNQVATVAAIYTWVFALCQFVSGAMLDRLGAGRIIPISILIVTVGVFLFANAQSYSMLLLSQLVFAVGACSGFVGAGYVGGQWFGMARFSFMFGLVQFAASFFSAFNQSLLVFALDQWSWRALFNGIGVLGIVLFILGAMFIRNPRPVVRPPESFGAFMANVFSGIGVVFRIPHVLLASAYGALCFGVMLGLGVVWAPKLLIQRGFDTSAANWSAALLWLGLAIGCMVIPKWSDAIGRRKLPMIAGISIQLAAFIALLYTPGLNQAAAMALCLVFGFGNASHMLAFSTAADVVAPEQIGTSAAIVNGAMFIFGGIMISRPGVRIGLGLEEGLDPTSLDFAQYVSIPALVALAVAFILSLVIRETYPVHRSAE